MKTVTIDINGSSKTVQVEDGTNEEITKRAFMKAYGAEIEYTPFGKPMTKEEYLGKMNRL
ncbi:MULTISPECIES: hypothetical protein [Priestia]|uniref:hypothetical protein n=1 Tax=Priestia TaxID=2800373 RepID=UPI00210AAE16|nr:MULTISPECIES: hypothetical protein [Priestia]MED4098393.1 hypothetical protein [Priestia megaterium]